MFFLSCVLIFLNLFYFLQISLPIHTYVQIYDIIFSRFFLKKFLDIFSFTIQWLASSTVVRTSLLINIFLFFVSFLFLFCFDILSFDSLILFLIKTLFRHFPTDLFQSVGCLWQKEKNFGQELKFYLYRTRIIPTCVEQYFLFLFFEFSHLDYSYFPQKVDCRIIDHCKVSDIFHILLVNDNGNHCFELSPNFWKTYCFILL